VIVVPIAKPSPEVEAKINERMAALREEYAEEERLAAEEERLEREERDRKSSVYSVRLPPEVYDAVRLLAEKQHLTPSALIRQWVCEQVAPAEEDDLTTAVADLRRDVERLAKLARSA
jgi:hypothetical protein